MELFDSLQQLNESRRRSGRRKFLVGGLGVVATYFGYRWWRDRPRPVMQQPTRYLTPVPEFYSVSIDDGFVTPATRENWRLEVAGLNGVRFSLGYDELLALERRRVFKTFECVGNEVGGPRLGNAEWTATPLAPLVRRALGALGEQMDEQRAGKWRVNFRALDGFSSSVPLQTALDPQAFIAYEMNGAPLTSKHGFPARVLLPGVYGMKQPRWLQRIEITDGWALGYWEKRGWCHECPVKMTARVDAATAQANGEWLITGVAYCGAPSVARVECSFDEGRSWQAAQLTSEQHPNAWATWQIAWRPAKSGEQIITARVIDATGARQIESYTGAFPTGATGLHRVIVRV